MKNSDPIKRSNALKPLSREHHHGLLLCWKINKGISKGVSPDRIEEYAGWFYKTYLLPHFEIEEKYVFPILGNSHEYVVQALAEHQLISAYFMESGISQTALEKLAIELEKHIRFEERTLFNKIQDVATPAQLDAMMPLLAEKKFVENGKDVFWI